MSTISVVSYVSTSITTLDGGVTGIAGVGATWQISVSGSWVPGDQWTVVLTDAVTALITQVGYGYSSGVQPTYLYTFANKVYALGGPSMYASALGLPLTWNDPTASGNGFITMSNWTSSPITLEAMAIYQGKLAFFARDCV